MICQFTPDIFHDILGATMCDTELYGCVARGPGVHLQSALQWFKQALEPLTNVMIRMVRPGLGGI